MVEMLSPGVYVQEIDASAIVPTVSNSITCFAGKFDKGPVEQYILITTVDELKTYFGYPGDDNYNDWMQCYNFLQYANKLYVARAANTSGAIKTAQAAILSAAITADSTKVIPVTNTSGVSVGDLVSLGDSSDTSGTYYEVVSVITNTSVTVDRNIENAFASGDPVNIYIVAKNGVFEPTSVGGTDITTSAEYLKHNMTILNFSDYENKETSIAFTNDDAKIKIIAKNPGDWAEDLEIAIATPSAFDLTDPSYAFDGISLDDLFEYSPTGTEIGIVVKLDDTVVEIFTVDFDPAAKDTNNKSTYIENVINNQSNYIFVKDNTANTADIKDYLFTVGGSTAGSAVSGTTISLVGGLESDIQADDLQTAYDLFDNKEWVDIDIVIGNERDSGLSAFNLAETRQDCIAFIGAEYSDCVGKKASEATANLITWRKTGAMNVNSSYVAVAGNYKYQYDKLLVA